MTRYLLAWLPMVAIAVANVAAREAWLLPRFGDSLARQISTLSLLALFAIYVGAVFRLWPLASGRLAIGVGLSWLLLTLAFEFGLGSLSSGRLWILVPVWVAVAPYIFHTLQERH